MKPQNSYRSQNSIGALLLGVVYFTAPCAAYGQSLEWDPAGAGSTDGAGDWLAIGDWWNGAANVDWTLGSNAVFGNGGAGGVVTLSNPTTAGSLTFNGFSGTYTLGTVGQALTINTGITMNAGAGNVSISSPVILGGSQTWTNNSTFTLTIPNTNTVTNGGFDLTIGGTGTTKMGLVSGSGAIIKNGTGRLDWLTNNTSFTGTVSVNGGILQMTNNAAALGTGNLTLNGGVLSFYWGTNYNRTLGTGTNQVQILGGESGFAGAGTSGPTINLGSSVVWGASGEGSATGYFNPAKFVLGDSGTNNAATTVFSSGIDLNGAMRTISVPKGLSPAGNITTVSGVISSTGAGGGLTKEGEGRLILTATNTYTGNTVVSGGVLRFGNGWSNTWGKSLPTASNLEINGGMVEAYYALTRTLGIGAGEIQFTGGRSGITNLQGDASGNYLTFTNTSTSVTWGTSTFNPTTLVLNDVGAAAPMRWPNPFNLNGASRTIEVSATGAGGGRGTYGSMEGNLSGVGGSLIKTGLGTLLVNGNNSYDGGTTINQGGVWFNKITAMPASGTVTLNDGTILSVGVGNSGGWTTGTSGAGTIGGLLTGTGGQGNTVSYSGNVKLGLNVSGNQTYAGNIGNLGTSLGLHIGNKDGGIASDPFTAAGTLELSGNNTFSGGITVNAGTVILSGNHSGASGGVTLNHGYLNSSQSNMIAGSVTFLASSASNPAILQSSGILNRQINTAGGVYWTGNGGFAATDLPLTVTLQAGSTLSWAAATGFNAKTLQLGSPTSTAAVEVTNHITINNNYSVQLFDNPASSGDVSILSGNIIRDGTSSRNLSVSGSGTLVLSGSNNLGTGSLSIGGGAVVRATDGNGLPTDALLNLNGGVFESNGTFARNINNSATNVYWGNGGGFAANGGALNVSLEGGVKLDWTSATVGFNNKSFILGSSTANNVVTIQNDIDLKSNRTVTVNDNADSGADHAVLSGVIANGDATPRTLTKNGNGILVLSGANSYTGGSTISQGTLTFLNTNAKASTGTHAFAAGTTLGLGVSGANAFTSTDITNAFNGTMTGNLAGITMTATTNLGVDTSNANFIYNDSITGSPTKGLSKLGINSLTLAGANTYTGATRVNAGSLIINGSTSASSVVTVASGATLGGSGTVGGNTTISGIHSAGNSPGLLTHSGNLTYNSGASVVWELVANTTSGRGTNFDGINVSGALDFAGATSFNLVFDFSGSAVNWQDSFWNSSHTGTNGWLVYSGATSLSNFNNLTLTTANWLDGSNQNFDTYLNGNSFSLYQDNNNVYLSYQAAVIPEPRAVLLCSLGLLLLLRRFRRHS